MTAKNWDRQLEEGLPDCRLKERNGVLITGTHRTIGRMVFEPCFCANCGCDGGLVTAGVAHIFYVCDECFLKLGGLPLPEVPEEIVRGMRNG